MSVEKIPKNEIVQREDIPAELRNAMKLLSDRNVLGDLLKKGEYRPIANRIATLVSEIQRYKKTDELTSEDIQTVKSGIQKIFDMPACKQAEKQYLLKVIEEVFTQRGLTTEYLKTLDFEG